MDLAHCQSLNLQCIEKIITNCVQLTEVNFDNTDLTESALNFICNNISPTILKLSLQELKVNDENISILVKRCPKITELALIGTNISDMEEGLCCCYKHNNLEVGTAACSSDEDA